MNLRACLIVLRPRGPLASFDLAVVLHRVLAAPLARVAVAALGPLAAAALVLWPPGLVGVVGLILPVLQVPFLRVAGRALFAEPTSVREALAAPPLLAAVILPSLLGAGLITLGIGVLPMGAVLLFLPEVLVLERLTGGAAVLRAFALSAVAPGATLVGALLLAGVHVGGLLAGELMARVVWEVLLGMPMPGEATGDPQLTAAAVLGLLAVTPFSAVLRLALYVDARTVAEGWDLQVALMAAGTPR